MQNFIFVILCFFVCPFAHAETEIDEQPAEPNPFVTGIIASVIPGGGYYYLGQNTKGAWGLSLAVPMILSRHITTPDRPSKSAKTNVRSIATDLYQYTIYDSYQEALTAEHRSKLLVNHPHYTFNEMMLAPLHYQNYLSWRMIPPNIILAATAVHFIRDLNKHGVHSNLTRERIAVGIPLAIINMFFTGMGEESQFRGFQYPAFAQATGSKLMGNVLQAASFGSCHTNWATSNGICTQPYLTGHLLNKTHSIDRKREYISPPSSTDGGDVSDERYFTATFLTGLYLGWVSNEEHGLLRAIAYHSMHNTLLTLHSLLVEGNTGRMYISIGHDF